MSQDKVFRLQIIRADELAKIRSDLTAKIVDKDAKHPDTEKQLEFARRVVSERICDFLDLYNNLPKEEGCVEVQFPDSKEKMTESEYSGPPLDSEQKIYERLKLISPRTAASTAFWTTYHIELIQREIIEPGYLAAKAGASQTGRARLESAIKRENNKQLDESVRTVLRRLGGLPEVRGNVSVFVDCHLARAWWRGYIANAVAEDSQYDCNDIWSLLHLPGAPWVQMMEYGVKRLTVISDRKVRSAFIARLIELQVNAQTQHRKYLITDWLGQIGKLSAGRELGFLEFDENLALFQNSFGGL